MVHMLKLKRLVEPCFNSVDADTPTVFQALPSTRRHRFSAAPPQARFVTATAFGVDLDLQRIKSAAAMRVCRVLFVYLEGNI